MENIRRIAFWGLDRLKGSPIKNHYDEVKFVMEDPNSPRAQEIKSKHLKNLLNHATSTTNYYSNYSTASGLEDFPIINKSLVINDFDSFKSRTFQNKKNFPISTGGSTGIPFKLWHDKNKKNRNTADTIYFSALANYKLGNQLVYLKLWAEKHKKSKLTLFIQNILSHDVMDVSSKHLEQLIKQITKNSNAKTIIGYASFLEQLSKYLDKVNIEVNNANIQSIISIAEALNEDIKRDLSSHFNTEIYNRYSNQENGILAQQTINSPKNYVLNSASYKIELLHTDKDEPAPVGSWGRIVISDLFNYAMPLIRYDTGDLGIVDKSSDGSLQIKEVLGRKFDMIYDTKGQLIIPHSFYQIFDYSICQQFQFVQEDEKKYTFIINGEPKDTDKEGAASHFRKLLGNDAEINFDFVTEIPQLSSGKRQKVASKYKKKSSD